MSNDQNQFKPLASTSKAEPAAIDLSTAAPIEVSTKPPAIDLSTAVPIEVPVEPAVVEPKESEVVYWSSWAIPKAILDDLLGPGLPEPMSDITGTVAPKWKKAIADYWEKKKNTGKIPPREDVAPPLPKPFDPSCSVPPTIGARQSLPEYRVTCAVCRSINKGIDPPAHNCADFQL